MSLVRKQNADCRRQSKGALPCTKICALLFSHLNHTSGFYLANRSFFLIEVTPLGCGKIRPDSNIKNGHSNISKGIHCTKKNCLKTVDWFSYIYTEHVSL